IRDATVTGVQTCALPILPGLNGIEATRRIVADSPHIAVVVLTMFDDDDSIFSALRAGARGYLLKGADGEQIRTAIHAAANGEIKIGRASCRERGGARGGG